MQSWITWKFAFHKAARRKQPLQSVAVRLATISSFARECVWSMCSRNRGSILIWNVKPNQQKSGCESYASDVENSALIKRPTRLRISKQRQGTNERIYNEYECIFDLLPD